MKRNTLIFLATLPLASLAALYGADPTQPMPARIPLIDVTDLYHPHQDVGDNFDILAAYSLPEVDLRAVILDCTEPFRQPVAKNPGPGLFPDTGGPREPGFIPVLQLNYIFGRNVPCATCPFTRMKSVGDKMLDAPRFQQEGIELILKTLRESAKPVQIVSFGEDSGQGAQRLGDRRLDLPHGPPACETGRRQLPPCEARRRVARRRRPVQRTAPV